MKAMSRIIGWCLLVPSVLYLAVQAALFIEWLVVDDSSVTWNISLIIAFFIVAVVGGILREYGKQSKGANNAEK